MDTSGALYSNQPQKFHFSEHALKRMRMRAVRMEEVEAAVDYGSQSWSHGDRLYVLTDRALRGTHLKDLADRLRGLCVVLTNDGVVRTVKWLRRLRHRPGVLRGAYRAARWE